MSIVHVYPLKDREPHVVDAGGCWCEPEVEDHGVDAEGTPARVMVHQQVEKRRGAAWMREFRRGFMAFLRKGMRDV